MYMQYPPFSQKLLVIAISAVLWAGGSSVANAQSFISTDGSPGTPPAVNFAATTPVAQNIVIDGATHGTQNGTNLFFSFSQFSIAAGDTVLFQCPDCQVTNVISRVTGTNPSILNGAITSNIGVFGGSYPGPATFTSANFWFFNPNGVTLGTNLAVNFTIPAIPPSFDFRPGGFVSSGVTKTGTPTVNFGDKADRVLFNNGAIFGLTTSPTDSTLTAQVIGTQILDTNPITSVPIFGSTPSPASFGYPPPPPPVIEPPPIRISPQGDISMVVASQPAMVNAAITPPVSKKPCDKANGVLGKDVANYVPEIGFQVPYSVLGKDATSGESSEQTPSSSLDESDGCL